MKLLLHYYQYLSDVYSYSMKLLLHCYQYSWDTKSTHAVHTGQVSWVLTSCQLHRHPWMNTFWQNQHMTKFFLVSMQTQHANTHINTQTHDKSHNTVKHTHKYPDTWHITNTVKHTHKYQDTWCITNTIKHTHKYPDTWHTSQKIQAQINTHIHDTHHK